MKSLPGSRAEVVLNKEIALPLYQRSSDGFFCLSQACKELNKEPIAFLKSARSTTTFTSYGKSNAVLPKVNLTSLVKNYPELIWIERSPYVIESGIWLSQVFIPGFLEWSNCSAIEPARDNWELPLTYSNPLCLYELPDAESGGSKEVWIRESDDFVEINGVLDLGRKSVDKVLASQRFIAVLEQTLDQLGLEADYEALNDQSVHYSERLRKVYGCLYDVQIIEGKQTVWLHPKVALALNGDRDLFTVVFDAIERKKRKEPCYITHISDWNCKASPKNSATLTGLRYPGCQVQLYDGERLMLKVKHPNSYWQYAISLKTGVKRSNNW